MKTMKLLFFSLLMIASNTLYANTGINVNDPPDIHQGDNCTTTNCSIHVTLVIGYMMGTYNEKERLNTMVCDSIEGDTAKTVQCAIKKYVSKPDSRGCLEKTNYINVSFVMLNIPKIDGETGYQYSCQ